MDETENKKTKGSPYFVQELTYLLAHVEEKIPFVQIGEEVNIPGFYSLSTLLRLLLYVPFYKVQTNH